MRGALIGCVLLASCNSVEATPGYDAPIRVQGAQYFAGPLPGTEPDAPAMGSDSPHVTAIELDTPLIFPGAANVRMQGRVEDEAVAIALAIPSLGNVHWVFPANGGTPEFPGELTWLARVSFDRNIPPGFHALLATGIDAQGHAGRQFEQSLCFLPTYPDNLHACDPATAPPDLVITLDWDRDADVDLELVTPEGRRVDPTHPLVVAPIMGVADAHSPRLDRDSLRDCVPDGWRQESVAFDTRPSGTWQIYARLFEGCGQATVRFRLRVLEAQGDMPNRELVTTFEQGGELITQYDADEGAGTGLLVAQLDL